jgi:rubrerythrin
MPLPNYNRILLDLLEEQEEMVGKLYELYAERFPERRDFWQKLAKDERNHAKWIRMLRTEVEQGSMTIDPRHLKLEELGKFTKLLKENLARADAAPLREAQVFQIAAQIEAVLLEEPFKKVFLSRDRKAAKILENLIVQTKGHADAVTAMAKKVGPEDLWLFEKTGEGVKPRK